jgi:hypothetical protein
MFRKLTLALIATAALGTGALAPTSASAWGWHGGGWYGGWGHRGWGYGGPRFIVGPGYGYGRGWCYWHPYRCGRW